MITVRQINNRTKKKAKITLLITCKNVVQSRVLNFFYAEASIVLKFWAKMMSFVFLKIVVIKSVLLAVDKFLKKFTRNARPHLMPLIEPLS